MMQRWLEPLLARRIAVVFLLSYLAILSVGLLAMLPLLIRVDDDNQVGADVALSVAATCVIISPGGALGLEPSPALLGLQRRSPALWVIAEAEGGRVIFGSVPRLAIVALAQLPSGLSLGAWRLAGQPRPLADVSIETIDTTRGRVRLAVGGVDPVAISWGNWLSYLVNSQMILILPLFASLGIAAVFVTVPVVLRGIRPLAAAAAAIVPATPGRRLPETGTVRELRPLVKGFNAALDRIEAASERRRRFIADVAHELRTPLAILGVQVDAVPSSEIKTNLQRSLYRLGGMVGQMLDAERLALAGQRREPIDLVELVRIAVADIAPLALASGYDVSVATDTERVPAEGDPHAIGRALTNVLANAVAHGGGVGLIEVRVSRNGTVEVTDAGAGVAAESAEQIFEPFRRERWDKDGCGLGLHLVREVMRAHGGDAILVGSAPGATFRLSLPVPPFVRKVV